MVVILACPESFLKKDSGQAGMTRYKQVAPSFIRGDFTFYVGDKPQRYVSIPTFTPLNTPPASQIP